MQTPSRSPLRLRAGAVEQRLVLRADPSLRGNVLSVIGETPMAVERWLAAARSFIASEDPLGLLRGSFARVLGRERSARFG